ncbi:RsmE family RNA methyltransferase, partial [Candidatus Bathyarchaeota archaeon]|nr:RsmE family RNA methyltransferase [Candidatus Bathyarchaeota archaeon]
MIVYGQVPATFNPPELEKKILELWKREKAFETLVQLNAGKPPWSFMDGPITANNPMGVHHGWGRTYKDLYQRFWAARGRDLRYQNGFDCQGLWVEVEVEKELGFKSKRDIEDYGIAEFIKKCKQRVLNYAAVQTEQSIRLGYWMHWDDTATLRRLATLLDRPKETVTVEGTKGAVTDSVEQLVGRLGRPEIGGSYYTFSNENNYMIWALLRKCHERGWIFKGRDVMPWCPRCSTALSQHEIVTEGYREVVHLSIFVKFPLRERKGESLLVWTTTPWTLTSNVAAAVHPELVYVKVRSGEDILWLAESALERAFTNKKKLVILETLTGSEMEGWTFSGPFDELPAEQSSGAAIAHRVILWKEVSQTEVRGRLIEMMGGGEESALIITLAQALPRWPKMDLIVKKATELGASQIIPLLAERTPSRGEAGGSKLSRWRRIAKESAEQCLRQTAPEIEPPQDLVTFLERGLPGVKIVFWEGETERRLRQALRADPSSAYTLLVGPEGGFSLQEVERARARGYISVSLGPRILRTE